MGLAGAVPDDLGPVDRLNFLERTGDPGFAEVEIGQLDPPEQQRQDAQLATQGSALGLEGLVREPRASRSRT